MKRGSLKKVFSGMAYQVMKFLSLGSLSGRHVIDSKNLVQVECVQCINFQL